MIRNIITAAILLAAFISMASIAQIASALEPNLNLEFPSLEDNSDTFDHPFAWTPDMAQQQRIINLYQRLILPNNNQGSSFSGSITPEYRLFSFEIYQGDGLDDLRSKPNQGGLTLPDEDESAYGVSVKQRF